MEIIFLHNTKLFNYNSKISRFYLQVLKKKIVTETHNWAVEFIDAIVNMGFES